MTTQGADKDQQDQTREFFESYAQEWQRQAVSPTSYDLIAARNGAVIHVLAGMKDAKRLLDVGCGTGQLVIDAAAKGIHAVGIDFAADMIAHCEANRKKAGVDAEFIVGSFFDMPNPAQPFDLISAQGFIEYISPEQTEAVFRKARTMLSPQGALVVGSRNRLFNVVSLNDYTKAELELGTFADLVGEALAFQTSSQAEAFDALRNFERIAKQPKSHPRTGIGVDVRYQYSPADLIKRLRDCGFQPQTIFPIHYHALPAKLASENQALHAKLATLMGQIAPLDPRLIPFCSTFVLDARRTG